jgi:hypothetical protein
MYFGTRHTETAMGLSHIERTCRKCGRRGVAEVAAEGHRAFAVPARS